MSANEIHWPGQSGTKYLYYIHPLNTAFVPKPGNYLYAKETRPGYWVPVYIGQTDNLRDRLSNHEKEACARHNGATHIHAHASGGETARLAEEADLIARWQPTCNTQGK